MQTTRRIAVAATLAAMVTLSGCALTPDRIDLQYNAQTQATQVAGANGVVIDVRVVDQRPDKTRVGSKKNGFGMEMAPILATEDVTVTVARAITSELKARGFQIAADTAIVKISADISRFYNDFKVGLFAGDAVADLNMLIVVKTKTGEVQYTREVVAQGVESNTMIASGENAQIALRRALDNGMKSLFEDPAFLAAISRPRPSYLRSPG